MLALAGMVMVIGLVALLAWRIYQHRELTTPRGGFFVVESAAKFAAQIA